MALQHRNLVRRDGKMIATYDTDTKTYYVYVAIVTMFNGNSKAELFCFGSLGQAMNHYHCYVDGEWAQDNLGAWYAKLKYKSDLGVNAEQIKIHTLVYYNDDLDSRE